jgi:murein DD-endopeptidase MepM/ murein hydrolase activator NlpD
VRPGFAVPAVARPVRAAYRGAMTHGRVAAEPAADPVLLALPFSGPWLVQNSPARRVPSHGTDLFGERYAIDFVGVDDRGHTATHRDWGTWFGTEPVDRFVGFGRPVLAPASGSIVAVHDGEADHDARRSQFALLPYALGQAARVRAGVAAVAGNHVVIRLAGGAGFVALVHLRAGSIRVGVGEAVTGGQHLAGCGNSGNSTQPHLHLQAMDSLDLADARGLPIVFGCYRERAGSAGTSVVRASGVPAEGSIVEPEGATPKPTCPGQPPAK